MKKFFLLIAVLAATYAVSAQPSGYVPPCNHVFTVDASYYNGSVYNNGATVRIVIPGAVAPLTITAAGMIFGVPEPYADNSFFTAPAYSSLNSFYVTIQPQTSNPSMIRQMDVSVKDNAGKLFHIIINQNPYYIEHSH